MSVVRVPFCDLLLGNGRKSSAYVCTSTGQIFQIYWPGPSHRMRSHTLTHSDPLPLVLTPGPDRIGHVLSVIREAHRIADLNAIKEEKRERRRVSNPSARRKDASRWH
jgi:hypothetical protein